MLDDHNEVKEIKKILLQWLITYGKDEITGRQVDNMGAIPHIWLLIEERLIYENTNTDSYRYSLTDKGIEYVGQRS